LIGIPARRIRLLNRLVPIALFLLLLGGAAAPKKTVAPLAATVCEAVPKQQVEAALERRVWKGEWAVKSSPNRCDYQIDGGQITIRTEHSDKALVAAQEFAGLREAFPEAQAEEFRVDDAPALLLKIPKTGVQVFVIPGTKRYVQVSILGFGDGEKVTQAARRLVREVVR
jgi:hypothetical protein